MKKLWITLDDDTAALARERAAERNMSLSRYVGELLREREDLHDRPGLRRR